jgi:DNA-binding CsgD family transcriptional regulator
MASSTHSTIFATGEPAYAVDRHGTIVAWNAAASRAFGYRSPEAVGRKCWELLQGRDAFGNQYCSESCPMRQMALQHKAVNRCRMSFQTAGAERQDFTVTTLVLFDASDAALIHLCRKEPAAAREGMPVAAPGDSGRDDGHGVLTPRERQVLEHLSAGRTTREIATLMRISVPTVRNHVERILHKLHAHSRLEAVAVSRRLGL